MQHREERTDQHYLDDYLDRVIIGERKSVPIVITEYDPDWPQRFRTEHARIASALGSIAKSIEHIGSTSVPGLAAKPIIDILVTMDDLENDAAYLPNLEAIGFILRVREPEHRMFRPSTKDDVHLHIWPADSWDAQRHILFRDWLRRNEADRKLYEATKRELAQRQWKDMNYYADAKSEVIKAILQRAQEHSR